MEEIFDRLGLVVGWLDGDAVFDRASGRWIAFVTDDLVYTEDGAVLGFFRLGFFRDRRGGAVAFTKAAYRGPELPTRLREVAPPPVPPKPARPCVPPRPPLPVGGVRWGTDWWSFVQGLRVVSFDKLVTEPPKEA